MRRRQFTAEDRRHYYERYRALQKEGLRFSNISERLGLPYHTLRDVVDRTEGKGKFCRTSRTTGPAECRKCKNWHDGEGDSPCLRCSVVKKHLKAHEDDVEAEKKSQEES